MRVLSIQSHVAFGHVGNSAAVFPLQRLGHEVVPVPTVVFAHHTGYGAPRGHVPRPEQVADLVDGLDDLGVLAEVDVVLSGYLTAPLVPVVQDAVSRVRAANPRASYACDPVIGDHPQGVFVQPEVPALLRDLLVPAADLVTPNAFELGHLTGLPVTSATEALAAARALRAAGPSSVLVTSVPSPEGVGMLAVTPEGAWSVTTPLLPFQAAGSGDLTAALFTAHLLASADPARALALTASSVHGVLRATYDAGARELCLVQHQHLLADPPGEFEATPLR